MTDVAASLAVPRKDGVRTVALLLGVAGAAWLLGRAAPVVGAPVAALLLGVVARLRFEPGAAGAAVLSFTSRSVLQAAIVVLGATLGLRQVAEVGGSSLPILVITLVAVIATAWLAGRALGIEPRLGALIAVGTGICGASAIAAVSRVIGARQLEVAYAISTIFVFNLAAVLIYPHVGEALGLSQHQFGLWAGTAINDTSSVVAAAYGYGESAGDDAVVVKLTRTMLIVPVVLAAAAFQLRGAPGGARSAARRAVPPFLLLFVAAAALNSVGLVPAGLTPTLADVAVVLITVALAAVGLSTRAADLRRAGPRPIVFAAVLSTVVALSGLLAAWLQL